MTEEEEFIDKYYVMHSHGNVFGRHAHHVRQSHYGSIHNPSANDHTGVESITWAEFRERYKKEHQC